MESIDNYWDKPKEMKSYLSNFGWHFNKKMFDYGVSLLKQRNIQTNKYENLKPISKEEIETLMNTSNIVIENVVMYDLAYLINYAKALFSGNLITNEKQLLLFARDYFENPHYSDGEILKCFYTMQISEGRPFDWSEMI